MTSTEQIRPLPGWALCRVIVPKVQSDGGIYFGRDMETRKTTEGFATVLRITYPADSTPVLSAGDVVLVRDYLKFVNPLGNYLGLEKDFEVFIVRIEDLLARLSGTGVMGHFGEYLIEAPNE